MAAWDTGSSGLPRDTDSMCPAQLSLLRAWAPSLPTPPGQDLHAVPVITSGLCPRVLTRLLPVLQMAPSEGAVTQIGLLSQDIHRLTVGF